MYICTLAGKGWSWKAQGPVTRANAREAREAGEDPSSLESGNGSSAKQTNHLFKHLSVSHQVEVVWWTGVWLFRSKLI